MCWAHFAQTIREGARERDERAHQTLNDFIQTTSTTLLFSAHWAIVSIAHGMDTMLSCSYIQYICCLIANAAHRARQFCVCAVCKWPMGIVRYVNSWNVCHPIWHQSDKYKQRQPINTNKVSKPWATDSNHIFTSELCVYSSANTENCSFVGNFFLFFVKYDDCCLWHKQMRFHEAFGPSPFVVFHTFIFW